MKKILCLVLSTLLVFSSVCVFAAENTNMQTVLETVKGKITVPERLTEFTSTLNKSESQTTYTFVWKDKDDTDWFEVRADEEGTIINYNYTPRGTYKLIGKQLSAFSDDEIKAKADEFLRKIFPEGFKNNNDKIVFSDISTVLNDFGTNYYISYQREVNGIPVDGQGISLSAIEKESQLNFTYFSANCDKNVKFNSPDPSVENPKEKFLEAYPIELVYERISFNDKKVYPVFRFKEGSAGFISAADGEKREIYYNTFGNDERDSGMGSGSADYAENAKSLTPEEQIEVDNMNGLMSISEAEKYLNNLSFTSFDAALKLTDSRYYKRDGKYYLSLYYNKQGENNKIGYMDNFSATFDAQSKILKSFYGCCRDNSEGNNLAEEQISSAKEKILLCLKQIVPDLDSYADIYAPFVYGSQVNISMYKKHNNIPCIEDTVYAGYDVSTGKLTSFSVSTEEYEYESSDNLKSAEEAYNTILNKYPLSLIYIKCKDGYELCYTIGDGESSSVYAKDLKFTDNGNGRSKAPEYSDIDNHWCKTAVNELKKAGIYFNRETFNPEGFISQADLLRYFAAGIKSSYFMNYDDKELYNEMISDSIISDNEANPGGSVLREDGFYYMVRLLGYGKLADIPEIFTTSFADMNNISKNRIGSASILSGLKVISGDGGYAYPKNNITNAEAAVMLYNLLKSR